MTDRKPDNNGDLADLFLNIHFPEGWARRDFDQFYAIDASQLDKLTDRTLDLIANIVSSIIDAGSERDAVNENEELWQAIRTEFAGWTNVPDEEIPPPDPNRTWD